jgi:hypothetical protein
MSDSELLRPVNIRQPLDNETIMLNHSLKTVSDSEQLCSINIWELLHYATMMSIYWCNCVIDAYETVAV